MEQILEVTFFKYTVRVRFAVDQLEDCVQHAEHWGHDEWAMRIREWLRVNHEARHMGSPRAPLAQLFDLMKALPGITSAEYIECHHEETEFKRGYAVAYPKDVL